MKEYRKRENETRRLKRGLKSTKSYDELFQLQSGKCAICQRKSPDRNLSFDHDHKTGNARGLLCFRCNLGLGYFQDNINYLGEAIFYLKNNIA